VDSNGHIGISVAHILIVGHFYELVYARFHDYLTDGLADQELARVEY
jgi:hypothetical protein